MGHRAAPAWTSGEPLRTHGGAFMWAVAWVVACGAHPGHRPRWNQPQRAQPGRRPGAGLRAVRQRTEKPPVNAHGATLTGLHRPHRQHGPRPRAQVPRRPAASA